MKVGNPGYRSESEDVLVKLDFGTSVSQFLCIYLAALARRQETAATGVLEFLQGQLVGPIVRVQHGLFGHWAAVLETTLGERLDLLDFFGVLLSELAPPLEITQDNVLLPARLRCIKMEIAKHRLHGAPKLPQTKT